MNLPQNTDELIALIRGQGPDAVARRFRKPPVPSQLLRGLSESSPPEEAWVFLATYALSPSSLLEEIGAHAADYPAVVLVPLAQNPRTPPGTLSALLHHDQAKVRASAACNPNLPGRDIQTLLAEPDMVVWRSLATNPALKFKAQAILASQGDASVRLELIQNKSLHPDLLVALSSDPSPLVRYTLAASIGAEDDILQFWADSDREEIQLALLSRKDLPESVWQSLLMSPHASVRRAIGERFPLDPVDLLFLSRSAEFSDRDFVARREDLPAGLQHELVQDNVVEVRQSVARNPAIWPEIAEFVVTGEDVPACLSLLGNQAMPEGLYLELAWMNHPEVTAALAGHKGTPEAVLQYLVNEQYSAITVAHMAVARRSAPWMRAELADALASFSAPSLRALAATSLHLSESARNGLREDPCPRVRHLAYEFPPAAHFSPITTRSEPLQRCLDELDRMLAAQGAPETPTSGKISHPSDLK